MIRICFIFLVVLGGCQATQKSGDTLTSEHSANQSNPWLQQAEHDVNLAIEQGIEWQVRHEIVNNDAVSLSKLLIIAQELQHSGKSEDATRLSIEISKLVVLAQQQAHDNHNASPLYPQND
jgi:hypothetical protein